MKIAGTSSFSNINSVSFKRASLLWTEFSVKIRGVSFGYNNKVYFRVLSINSSSTSKFTRNNKEQKLTHSFFLEEGLDS
jgi:hypothetical protein